MLPSLAALSATGTRAPAGPPRKPGVLSRAWLFKRFPEFVQVKWKVKESDGDPPDTSDLEWNRDDAFAKSKGLDEEQTARLKALLARAKKHAMALFPADLDVKSSVQKDGAYNAALEAVKGDPREGEVRTNLDTPYRDAPPADGMVVEPPAAPPAEPPAASQTQLLEEGSLQQQARFVCRLVFGQRWAYKPDRSELEKPLPVRGTVSGTVSVTVKDMFSGVGVDASTDLEKAVALVRRARLEWAKSVVRATPDPASLFFDQPPPPRFLPAELARRAKVPAALDLWLLDFAPPAAAPAAATPERGMPAFAGPTVGLRAAGSAPDGLDVLLFVHELRRRFAPPSQAGAFAGTPLARFQTLFLEEKQGAPLAEQAVLQSEYGPIVEDLRAMKVDLYREMGREDEVAPGAENAVYRYTQNSGAFNRLLRVDGPPAPAAGDAEERHSVAEAYRKNVVDKFGYQSETRDDEAFRTGALARLHKLWRTIHRAPRAPQDCLFLRSATRGRYLPGEFDPANVGKTYFEPSFISATANPASIYFTERTMKWFLDQATQCCVAVLNVKAGTPMLPLWFAPSVSAYGAVQREVILAPCTLWTFEGLSKETVLKPNKRDAFTPPGGVTFAHFTVRSAFA